MDNKGKFLLGFAFGAATTAIIVAAYKTYQAVQMAKTLNECDCNCDDDFDCGCKDGKECTCGDDKYLNIETEEHCDCGCGCNDKAEDEEAK